MPLHLQIVTPEKKAFEGDVDEVIVPGSEGELGILPHHAPLISLLGQGVLRLKQGATEQEFAIFGGFLQVRPDRVVVLAETADLGVLDAKPRRCSRANSLRKSISPAPGQRSSARSFESRLPNGVIAKRRAAAAPRPAASSRRATSSEWRMRDRSTGSSSPTKSIGKSSVSRVAAA
jgi:F-type H+-transporting ATPase subunit epsilon